MSCVSERRFEDEIEHSLLTRGSLVKCGREAIERLKEYRTALISTYGGSSMLQHSTAECKRRLVISQGAVHNVGNCAQVPTKRTERGIMPDTGELLERIGEGGIFRTSELEALGISRSTVQRMVERGEADQIAHGLYRLTEGLLTEHYGLAAVQKKVPNGIICLLSALLFHDIGTQLPRQVWVAIDPKARKPKPPGVPIRVVRFSGANATYGIETHELMGVPVRITSIPRTVVDCFRYRNKVGMDVALEALQDVVRRRMATPSAILRAAEACRAKSVVKPYLEAMLA